MFRAGLKWMFLILGTTIGAGYASGRELWEFFGHESVLAIALFACLFATCMHILMKMSYDLQSDDYLPVLEILLGKQLTKLYDIMIIVYLFTTTVVMFAGGGATLEAFQIPYWLGILVIGSLVVILFFWDIKGILAMNTALIPILVTVLLSILILFLTSKKAVFILDWHNQSNWPSAFTFTALNILPLVAVISAVGGKIKHKGEIWIASLGSGAALGGISFLYNQALIEVAQDLIVYEIPLFAILKHYPAMMAFVMILLLWFAIYTTAVSGVFGLISRFQKKIQLPWWLLAFILTMFMLPLTSFGFSTLISVLYPLYGIVNLYLLGAIILHPIAKGRSEN